MALETRSVSFVGSRGARLAGCLDLPRGSAEEQRAAEQQRDDKPRGYAVFVHCFNCTKDSPTSRIVTAALVNEGIATLRFDFTAHGESEGELSTTSFSSAVEDILCAATWLTREHEAPRLLIGHGFGGTAALVAASRIPSLVGVATLNAAADPTHLLGLLRTEFGRLLPSGEIEVVLSGRPQRLSKRFHEDFEAQTLMDALRAPGRALLVLHAPSDALVGPEHARRLFDAATHPKSFIALDGADHLLSRGEDATYAAQMIALWARRYIARPPA